MGKNKQVIRVKLFFYIQIINSREIFMLKYRKSYYRVYTRYFIVSFFYPGARGSQVTTKRTQAPKFSIFF